ncbi:Ceramide_synthetase [Hexamita inflata]|uniref:Ceramide synthetase n=1 Tax=Hexamita inflata TaxID=28002 RepID=A0AA86R8U0_9EUKA|nr:Ceramide synthetase [Hexamita inflata]
MQNLLQEKTSVYLPFIFVPLHMLFRYSFQKSVQKLMRRNKNAKKISESSFYFVQYLFLTILSFKISRDQNLHFFDLEALYSEKVFRNAFQPLHAIYLMGELSVYISAFIYMFFESRKDYADFTINIIHHISTISVIAFAYPRGNYNYSVAVAQIHDISDVFLEFSKVIFYLGLENASKLTFVVFAISFIIPRVFVFPRYLIAPFWNGKMNEAILKLSSEIDLMTVYDKKERSLGPGCLSIIYVLNCIWSIAILKMAVGMFRGRAWGDIREQDEKTQKSE